MSLENRTPNHAKMFDSLGEDERRELAEAGETIRLAAGKGLFQTGDAGGTL